ARSTAPRDPRAAPPEVRSEPSKEVGEEPGSARCALRPPARLEVHHRLDAAGQEVDRRARVLRRDGHGRIPYESAWRERVQAGAREPEARGRSEEPPCRWRHVPGPGRSAPRASYRACHALADQLFA